MNQVNFNLHATIRFDRPIVWKKDLISPGGYEMKFGTGKTVSFDFEDTQYEADEKDPSILHYTQKNLDYTAFPEAKDIGYHDLVNVAEIKDFYIDTDTEDGSVPLKPEAVLDLYFETGAFNKIQVRERVYSCLFGLKIFQIPVAFNMCGLVPVAAASPEGAFSYAAENIRNLSTPQNAVYLEDSMEVCFDGYYISPLGSKLYLTEEELSSIRSWQKGAM